MTEQWCSLIPKIENFGHTRCASNFWEMCQICMDSFAQCFSFGFYYNVKFSGALRAPKSPPKPHFTCHFSRFQMILFFSVLRTSFFQKYFHFFENKINKSAFGRFSDYYNVNLSLYNGIKKHCRPRESFTEIVTWNTARPSPKYL